jgi:hypothetical protein
MSAEGRKSEKVESACEREDDEIMAIIRIPHHHGLRIRWST